MATKKNDAVEQVTTTSGQAYFLPEEGLVLEATSAEDAEAKSKKLKGNK